MKSTLDTPKYPEIEELRQTFKDLEKRLLKMRVILTEMKKHTRVKSKMEKDLEDALNLLD